MLGSGQERAGDEQLSRADGLQKTSTTVRPVSESLAVRQAGRAILSGRCLRPLPRLG